MFKKKMIMMVGAFLGIFLLSACGDRAAKEVPAVVDCTTVPYSAECDLDNDGLSNGNEDKNWNAIVDIGETDPLNPDTDGDGVLDGVDGENGLTALQSCLPFQQEGYRGYDNNNSMWRIDNCDSDTYANGTEDNISLLPNETYLSDPYGGGACFASKSENDPCGDGVNIFIMCDVVAKDGKTWGDKNVGACRPCETQTDELCYGDLFQWGRGADGHEKRANTDTQDLNPTTFPYLGSSTHEITHKGDFDWMNIEPSLEEKSAFISERTASWARTTDNPICPDGWYVPSKIELQALMDSEGITNGATAFASSLKLGLAGARSAKSSMVESAGIVGYIWSRDSDGVDTGGQGNTAYSFTYDGIATFSRPYKAEGHSIRCIKQ